MNNKLEARFCITCHSCHKLNSFSLFNTTMIAAKDLVYCSNCRSAVCRWGDLAHLEEAASGRRAGPVGERDERQDAAFSLPQSTLH